MKSTKIVVFFFKIFCGGIWLSKALSESTGPQLSALFSDGGSLSLHEMTSAIRHAANDDRVLGIVLDVQAMEFALSQVQGEADVGGSAPRHPPKS